jgi:hypothetical protein
MAIGRQEGASDSMSELCCPTCGHAVDAVPMQALADARLSPQQRIMVRALIEAFPRFVERDRLFDELYGFDPNGGPENIANAVAVRLFHIRKALRPLGWTITKSKGGTGIRGRYRLEKIEA